MTPEIATALAILGVAVVLFVGEWVRVDVVALLVLVSLAVTGLVTPTEALSGFSNPAVVTVWAVLILSAGLGRTGVAGLVGRQVLRLAGRSEVRLIAVLMLAAATLSSFMNSIGVVALLLPVTLDISRQTGRAPSKLLMPLAFGTLMGALNTLIATPPNILVSEALRSHGLEPFRMFDFTPVGVAVTLAGTAYMLLIGRHLLPSRDIRTLSAGSGTDVREFFGLRERLFVLQLPADSPLDGYTLAESRIGAALGLGVMAVIREGSTQLAPGPSTVLRAGDRLVVEGRKDYLAELQGRSNLLVEAENVPADQLVSAGIELAQVRFSTRSSLPGQTLEEAEFRRRFGAIVLAVQRGGTVRRTNLESLTLQQGDVLLVQGTHAQLDTLRESSELLVSPAETADAYQLDERLVHARLPEGSSLAGKTLDQSRLGHAFGLGVMGIERDGTTFLMPEPEEALREGDTLLIKGRREDLVALEGLQSLEIDPHTAPELGELESEEVGLVEVVLSPHTTLAGRTLRQLHFREKHGLTVLAIWRGGRPYRTHLRDMALRFGDALLLYGLREKLRILGSEPDFLVLAEEAQEAPRLKKAPLATLIVAGVLLAAIAGWLPIAIAAVMGSVLIILSGCLTIEEAYRAIEWKAVFVIAGMLPMGTALEQTGAAHAVAERMVDLAGGLGPTMVMAALLVLGALACQAMPTVVVAVLLSPIALDAADTLGVSAYPMMMAVAVAASFAYLSPVGHAVNLLIMGPGGYRYRDYPKVGLLLTLVTLAVALLILPILWPF